MTEKTKIIENASLTYEAQPNVGPNNTATLPNQYPNSYISPVYAMEDRKTDMKKTGTRVCLLLILVTVISNFIQFAIAFPFSFKAALEHKPMTFMNDPLFQQLIMYIPTFIGIVTVILISRKVLKQRIFENYKKPRTNAKFLILGCTVCIGAGAFASVFANLLVSLLSLFGMKAGMANISTPSNLAAKIINISYLCIIGPIIEETLFRGIILKNLRRFGNVFAIIASSVLFGIFHSNLIQLIPTVCIGMVLAYIAIKSESIFPAIIAHAVNNTFSVVLSNIFKDSSSQYMAVYAAIMIAIMVVALIIIIHNRKKLKSIRNDVGSEIPGKQKCGYFFFRSWGFYLLLVLLAVNCIILSLSTSGLITKVG